MQNFPSWCVEIEERGALRHEAAQSDDVGGDT